jgi:poly(3-hydroxybutyrate) depolymerase
VSGNDEDLTRQDTEGTEDGGAPGDGERRGTAEDGPAARPVPACLGGLRVLRGGAVAFALLLALSSHDARAEGEDLRATLAAAVDLPTTEARLAAAAKLAARNDVTIDQWLEAMRGFGEFQRVPAGSATEKATLQVGAAREETSIAVFVPKGYLPDKPAPLLIALHGSGGEGHDEDDLWTAAADEIGMLVVAPTDPTAQLGLQYSEAVRDRVLAALRWARRRFDVDENRVALTGVSRGAHLAWDVALRHPDLFSALVPMIGGPRLMPWENNNLRYMENVAHLPIRDLQGSGDDPLLVKNLKMAFERLAAAGAKDAKLVLHPDLKHDFDPHAVDWAKFLGAAKRASPPPRVVRMCARPDEGRAAWAEITRLAPGAVEKFRPDVDARKWEAMNDDEKREWAVGEAEKRTGRLEVTFDGPGRFTAKTTLVQRFRLLLSREMVAAGAPVEVTVNGKAAKYAVTPSKLVLLREFVERFDRTFLPVAEVSCP